MIPGIPSDRDRMTATFWLLAMDENADIWTRLSERTQEQIRARIEWVHDHASEVLS